MKRVLIISYYWPPAGGPGSQRGVKFAKYLPQFGWEPIILTVKNGEFPYIDNSLIQDVPKEITECHTKSWEPFRLFKKWTNRSQEETLPVGLLTMKQSSMKGKIASYVRVNMFIPDARIGWMPFAVKAGLKIIKENKIDAIFTSSPPHSSQLIGLLLKKLTGIPWVADLRDPWTGIRYYKSTKRVKLANILDALFEKRVLNLADRITTVSNSFVKEFLRRGQIKYSNKYCVLPNGFDDADFSSIQTSKSDKFIILHTGNLSSQQNPAILLKSVHHLINKRPEIGEKFLLKFVGRVHPGVVNSLKEFDLEKYSVIQGFVPHRDILVEMKNASVLLMVVPEIEENEGIIPGKFFEYIGAARPVLVIGPPFGDAGKIIAGATNSTICHYDDEQGCAQFIESMYELWKSDQLPETEREFRKPFSRINLTEQLANLLNDLAEQTGD